MNKISRPNNDYVSRNPSYLNMVFMSIAIIGIVVRVVLSGTTSKDGSSGNATASVYGYSTTIVSLIALLFTEYALTNSNEKTITLVEFLKTIFIHSFPILSLIGLLSWNVQINSQYYTKINSGEVAKEYNNYALISNILSVLQIIIIFKVMSEKMNMTTKIPYVSENLSIVGYILLFINIIFTGMMQIVVQYFSTDG